jgi:hypothetical protein
MTGVWVERTRAAKRFREQTGYANFRLNTIVVGLEAVKRGVAVKPVDLAVHWQPKDVTAAAEQARGFATNAVMVYVVDALDSYMSEIGRTKVWIQDLEIASILTGDFQTDRSEVERLEPNSVSDFASQILTLADRPVELGKQLREFTAKHFGRRKRPGLPTRFTALVSQGTSVPKHYVSAVHFLISWRNRHVHGRSTDKVSKDILSSLRDASSLFYEGHAHLDVDRMINNYESGNLPTLKEISSLISVSHRVIASIDDAIVRRADPYSVFKHALQTGFSLEASPDARIKEYWGLTVEQREWKLAAMVCRFGFREVKESDPTERPLTVFQSQLREVAAMEREDFISLTVAS